MNSLMKLFKRTLIRMHLNGGAGSGNFGHSGRPGERGGSSDDGESPAPASVNNFIDDFANEHDTSWYLAGGCYDFAEKLKSFIGEEAQLANIYGIDPDAPTEEEVELHQGVLYKGKYYDINGGQTAEEFKGNWDGYTDKRIEIINAPSVKEVSPSSLKIEVHSEEVVDQYVKRIKAGEELTPVFVSKADASRVVDGNHRAEAYRKLKMDVPVFKVDRVDALNKMGEGLSPEEYFALKANGGAGSGNYAHAGRQGEVGGSDSGGIGAIHLMKDIPPTAKYVRGAYNGKDTDGANFKWSLAGKQLSKAECLKIEQAIKDVEFGSALAPGFTSVEFRKDFATAKGQLVTIVDSKGRSSSILDKKSQNENDLAKQGRVANMEDDLPTIRSTVDRDIRKGVPEAIAIKIIDETSMRIGSTKDTGGDVQAYGATTLLPQHVEVNGNRTKFTFIGKGGKPWNEVVVNSTVARFVSERLKVTPADRPVLGTRDSKVNDYLQKIPSQTETVYTAHNFRHHHATESALEHLKTNYREGMNMKEKKELVKGAIQAGADRIKDTPSVARKNYILPSIFEGYL